MQHNFRLVQLLLNLHDTIRLLGVLILGQIIFQRGEVELGRVGGGEGAAGVAGEEFVDDFGEDLVGDEGGVVVVGDDDGGDAFGAAVGVEGVGLFFDVLALAGACAFGDGFGEEGHEFAIAGGKGWGR